MVNLHYTSFAEFNAKFKRALTIVNMNLKKPLRTSADWFVKESIRQRFLKERDPSGRKWKALMPSTVKERTSLIKHGKISVGPRHPILRRTGDLMNKYTTKTIGKNTIMVRSEAVKDGSGYKRYGRYLHAKRPWMEFNRKDMFQIRKIFTDWTFKTLVHGMR